MRALHKAELRLAARNIPVFPCRERGKVPLTKHGCLDATTDPETITRWRSRWPNANIGIATGGAQRLSVVDLDGEEGEASLRQLEADHGALPETVEVITGGGGRHVYLRLPEGVDLGNSAGLLGGHIDTRGTGGYVLAPPSTHPCGRAYQWSVDCASTIAEAPAWLVGKLRAGRDIGQRATSPEVWHRIIGDGVEHGQRNASLARVAGLLFRRMPDPLLAAELAIGWNAVKCRPPLPEDEVKRTLDSIAAKEMRRRGLPT